MYRLLKIIRILLRSAGKSGSHCSLKLDVKIPKAERKARRKELCTSIEDHNKRERLVGKFLFRENQVKQIVTNSIMRFMNPAG
jgi:hypothetical protein